MTHFTEHYKSGDEELVSNIIKLIMRTIKQQITDGIERPNQEKVRTLGEKETYKC